MHLKDGLYLVFDDFNDHDRHPEVVRVERNGIVVMRDSELNHFYDVRIALSILVKTRLDQTIAPQPPNIKIMSNDFGEGIVQRWIDEMNNPALLLEDPVEVDDDQPRILAELKPKMGQCVKMILDGSGSPLKDPRPHVITEVDGDNYFDQIGKLSSKGFWRVVKPEVVYNPAIVDTLLSDLSGARAKAKLGGYLDEFNSAWDAHVAITTSTGSTPDNPKAVLSRIVP